MSTESDALLLEVLALPVGERARVAADLLASIDEPDLDDADAVEAAWARELEIRAHRALTGDDPGEPWAALRKRVRSQLPH